MFVFIRQSSSRMGLYQIFLITYIMIKIRVFKAPNYKITFQLKIVLYVYIYFTTSLRDQNIIVQIILF